MAAPRALTGLPGLLNEPRRRAWMAGLLGNGLAQSVLAGLSAHQVSGLLRTPGDRAGTIAWMVAAIVGVGALRVLERVIAEKLGQHYVNEIRILLLAATLSNGSTPSPGITIARATNDLTSVRNWVTMGIVPLAAGVPLVAGSLAAVWLLAPGLALAAAVPLALYVLALTLLARPALARARTLRRLRGRLAARVADAVAASTAIRAGGGRSREIRNIEELGLQLTRAAVSRAVVAGCLRASGFVAASLIAVAIAATGTSQGQDSPTIAAALTIAGIMAWPVNELGRAVEYRQNYQAARAALGPTLTAPRSLLPAATSEPEAAVHSAPPPPRSSSPEAGAGISVRAVNPADDSIALPDLEGGPGQKILIRSSSSYRTDAAFQLLLGLRQRSAGQIRIGGRNIDSLSEKDRRLLVGYAARSTPLERGTITRAVRYRRPDLPEATAGTALEQAGLADTVARLPHGPRTTLKRGGEPLSLPDRAKLQIARATLGNPPLLLLNHIETDLDPDGKHRLRKILAGYPGTIIIATDDPGTLCPGARTWDIG